MFAPWDKSYDKLGQHITKQRHHFANKVPYSQSYGFSHSHVRMWELDHKEGWGQKKGLFLVVVLGKTLESPLDCKEIKPVNPKGYQSWIFIGRTDAEAPIIWSPDAKSWLIGKDSDVVKEIGQEEKRATEDEMFGCHHWLKGYEFEWVPGDREGQGRLACCVQGVAKSQTGLSDATTTNTLTSFSASEGPLAGYDLWLHQ